jgi:hypothetical protein
MFPVAKDKLSFIDISDLWSRDTKTAPPLEVLELLEGAWWRGEIKGTAARTRVQLLQEMFTSLGERPDLGIAFVREGDQPPPQVTELPDGFADIDIRHLIPVPRAEVGAWNEQMCEEAFDALARTSSTDSYPDLAPFFASIELSFEEFDGWREARGSPKPRFWASLAAPNLRQGVAETSDGLPRYTLPERPTQPAAAYAHYVLEKCWGREGPLRSMSIRQIVDEANKYRRSLPPNRDYPETSGGLSESTVRRALDLTQ